MSESDRDVPRQITTEDLPPGILHGGGRRAVIVHDAPRAYLRVFAPDGEILRTEDDPDGISAVLSMTDRGLALDPELNSGADGARMLKNLTDTISSGLVRAAALLLPTEQGPDDPPPEAIDELADALVTVGSGETPGEVPAAYTYLGQIVAHDITLTRVDQGGAATALLPGALRFDSVFGRGSVTKTQGWQHRPFGAAPLGETRVQGRGSGNMADLPRSPDGFADIPDPRNDTNLNLAQMHVLLVQFAAAMNRLPVGGPEEERQRRVVCHLQSVIWNDYLRWIVTPDILADIEANGRRIVATPARGGANAFHVPLEFSWGAFQVLHAMIRGTYRPWGLPGSVVADPPGNATLRTLLDLNRPGDGRFRALPDNWRTNWEGMLGRRGGITPTRAARIGATLSASTHQLPGRLFDVLGGKPLKIETNLARRTMTLARKMRVPDAQAMILLASGAGAGLAPMSRAEFEQDLPARIRTIVNRRAGNAVSIAERTPLWFYCLREAAVLGRGQQLGPLGGRIVAETIHAAIEASGSNFFDPLTWRINHPAVPVRGRYGFDLHDLREVAAQF